MGRTYDCISKKLFSVIYQPKWLGVIILAFKSLPLWVLGTGGGEGENDEN